MLKPLRPAQSAAEHTGTFVDADLGVFSDATEARAWLLNHGHVQ